MRPRQRARDGEGQESRRSRADRPCEPASPSGPDDMGRAGRDRVRRRGHRAGARVLHGVRVIAEGGGTFRIGYYCIIVENAVIRASPRHPCEIADHCPVGPNAPVVGATLEQEVFVATAAPVFHRAHSGRACEVRPTPRCNCVLIAPRYRCADRVGGRGRSDPAPPI
jgi:hypothetical protein